jgi:hypothetical protein
MTPRFLGAALLVVCALACSDRPKAAPPAPAPAPPTTLAETRFTLANGLAVALVSGPCAAPVGVVLVHGAGSDHDPAGRSGLARLLGAVLTERAGAARSITVGREQIWAQFTAPAAGLRGALEAASAPMARLDATEAELARAKDRVLAALAARRGGDAALTAEAWVREAMRPARGDGWGWGRAEEIAAVTVAELNAFARAALSPASSRLVVVGRFDASAVRASVEAAFGTVARVAPPPLRPPNDASVVGTLVFGDAPAALAIGIRVPALGDPLHPAFALLATRLLRASSTPRTWTARYDATVDPELLYVVAARDALETPDAAAIRVRNEMMALLTPPLTDDDIAAARTRFGAALGDGRLAPARCAGSALPLAVDHARRALARMPDDASVEPTSPTPAQLDEARRLFAADRSAAILAGGTIR